MQMYLNHEVSGAMKMMKYAVNHPWKFQYPNLAFAIGFCQVFSTVLTALVCYFVIVTSTSVLDLAKDFTALMIISEFDNQFARFSREKIALDAVTDPNGTYADLFMIETTTSEEAKGGGNSYLRRHPDAAWQLIARRRHWNMWNELKRDNKVKYNVNIQRDEKNFPKW